MPVYSVKVKWGKETYPDVELNTDEEPALFKAQLFALTGVTPDRQKIMVKGGILKDNSWKGLTIKDGIMVMLMGTKEEDIATEPAKKPLFVEDMSEAELASAMDMPGGLENLGNTCYINATVQCLKSVPELKNSIIDFTSEGFGFEPTSGVVSAMKDVYSRLDKNNNAHPMLLVTQIMSAFPRFAERGEGGHFAQQDANELFLELMTVLKQKLPPIKAENQIKTYSSVIDQYFGGSFLCQMKNTECEEETVKTDTEDFLQLSCYISQEVKYLENGLRLKLKEHITKRSEILDRDSVYEKTSQIKRLPAYLTIQMVRFFYKEKDNINAKILKDIKFPIQLDVFDLCADELKLKLAPMRKKFKDIEDKEALEAKNKRKTNQNEEEKKEKKTEPYSFPDDLGSNNSGFYELQAVLTHKGRSSSSGHYVAWCRRKGDEWFQFDDDKVNTVTTEDILKLSGGGDWHCAYVLLYGPRVLEVEEGDEKMES
ncbi:ubiquitin carboxyl-terminal hydrolase 14-like [Artemia franciscana]|uniref:ubiquitin carboxyl-terminal hydrolase 14-like n=1 Tax=Artemia franciscana TaxID=6661 RepID=UPI0032DBE107